MGVPSRPSSIQPEVSALLASAESEGAEVWEQLVPLVYRELHALAHTQLSREGPAATLQTTELVHETYLRLVDGTRVLGNGRSYFYAAAARAMREVLVDHARRRHRQKRGAGDPPLTLRSADLAQQPSDHRLIELDQALSRLASSYPRAARVVECRFFGGLSTEETAAALAIAPRTVKRDWAFARAWLFRDLMEDDRRAAGAESES